MSTTQLDRLKEIRSIVLVSSPDSSPGFSPGSSLVSAASKQIQAPDKKAFCCYVNHSAQFQIIRITGAAHEFLERTVLPYARVFFEAYSCDHLEVHTGNPATSIFTDTIPCHRLIVKNQKSKVKSQKSKIKSHKTLTVSSISPAIIKARS